MTRFSLEFMVLLKLESLAQNILAMLDAVKKSNGALNPGKVGCAPGRLPRREYRGSRQAQWERLLGSAH